MLKNKPKFSFHIETLSAIFIIASVSAYIISTFIIGFSLPIYALAMTVAFILAVFYPRAGLYAIIFLTIIFERFFTLASIYIGREEYKLYPIDVIILAMFVGLIFYFFRASSERRKEFKILGNDWTLVLFVMLNVAYFLASIFIIKSDVYLSFSSLKNYGFYSLLYFLSFWLIQGKEDLRRLFGFFLAGAIGIIGFIFFGIINGGGLWTEFTPLSTSGVRILAFTHGLYLVLAFAATIAYLTLKKDEARNRYLYLILLIWIVGIAGSMMRHLWISIIFALVVLYAIIPEENKIKLRSMLWRFSLFVVCLLAFVFYAMTMLPYSNATDSTHSVINAIAKRGTSIANANSDESFAWRELVWGASYHGFRHDPLLGIGTGKMVYVQTQTYRNFIEVRNIHNSYLAVLIQLGFLGFATLVFFIGKNLWDLIAWLKDKKEKLFYGFSVLGVLAIYLVALVFQPYLETNLLAIFFWMTLGVSRNITKYKI